MRASSAAARSATSVASRSTCTTLASTRAGRSTSSVASGARWRRPTRSWRRRSRSATTCSSPCSARSRATTSSCAASSASSRWRTATSRRRRTRWVSPGPASRAGWRATSTSRAPRPRCGRPRPRSRPSRPRRTSRSTASACCSDRHRVRCSPSWDRRPPSRLPRPACRQECRRIWCGAAPTCGARSARWRPPRRRSGSRPPICFRVSS